MLQSSIILAERGEKNLKKCIKCKTLFSLEKFVSDKSRKNGKRNECLVCAAIRSKLYYHKHPNKSKEYRIKQKEKIKLRHRINRLNYIDQWISFLNIKYGIPKCQICLTQLSWFSGDNNQTVNFDHRHEGNEAITTNKTTKSSVNNWLRSRPCNEINKKIFESCDFGILCRLCNNYLPTLNRKEWLVKACQYSDIYVHAGGAARQFYENN